MLDNQNYVKYSRHHDLDRHGALPAVKPDKGDSVKSKPLYMSKCEISWDAYDIFCFQLDMSDKDKAAGVDAKSRPSRPYGDQTHGFGHAHYPAIHITRYAAEQFCVWLSKKTGHTYRRPPRPVDLRLPRRRRWEGR
jgi:formylglycine-generating enzyme required for sulfatase activity